MSRNDTSPPAIQGQARCCLRISITEIPQANPAREAVVETLHSVVAARSPFPSRERRVFEMLELDREAPLFESVLPVRLSSSETEEGERRLTVRLMSGSRVAAGAPPVETVTSSLSTQSYQQQSNHRPGRLKEENTRQRGRERVMHLELCDAGDPYFLYSLEVGEGDFHELRREHALLVDFLSFPQHFIELLEKCISEVSSRPNFGLALERTRGKLSIVESNKFKQVTHLALGVRKGDDAAVKAYLAGRLEQVGRREEALTAALSERTAEMERAIAEAIDTRERLASAEASARGVEARAEGARLAELAKLREQHATDLEQARKEHASALEVERASRSHVVDTSRLEIARLSSELAASAAARTEADTSRRDFERRVATLTQRVEKADAELETERRARLAAETERDEAEAAKHAAELRLAAASQRAEDAERAIERADALRTAADDSRKQTAEECERLTNTLKRRDDQLARASAEIRRGNAIIEKLSDQTRAATAKLRLKHDLAKQLEHRLDEMCRDRDEHKHQADLAKAEVARHSDARSALETDLADCRQKLKDAAELIENNQQVIQYLNAELNEHQLGRRDYYHNVVSPPIADYVPPKRTRDRLAKQSSSIANNTKTPDEDNSPRQDRSAFFHISPAAAPASDDPAAAYFERYADQDDSFGTSLDNEDTLGLSSTPLPHHFAASPADLRPSANLARPTAASAGFS